jgi:hypothetical protein
MRWIAASEAPKCGPHFEKDRNSSLAKIANNLQADARSLRDRLRAHAGPVRGHARLQPRAVVMVALMAIIGTTLFQVQVSLDKSEKRKARLPCRLER